MSTALIARTTPETTQTPPGDPNTKPSAILHHATMTARQPVDMNDAVEQLLGDLHPTRKALSEAYLTHVRRIHRKRVHGTEASRTLGILEAALHRRPRDVVL